ncbi:MAG: helicase, partial [Candidatus Izimaplasma sp.]|nr:helicase [Candidatus Izimaplasma bacterium]
MNTDLSVFTNMEDVKLKDRLEKVLTNSNYFDVLVGYFRMTGFYKLYKNLNEVQEIRILIGLGIDRKTVDMYQQSIDDVSKTKYLQSVQLKVEKEFIESDDNAKVEEGVHKFLEWLNSGKLKIRMTANRDVHAKLYIIRKNQDLVPDQFGNLITGSSNFSLSGLEKNIEFNVELKNSADVKYALEFFNKLWSESIEISEDIIDLVRNNTWMKSDITPYEMYLKTIYEYFEEELDENDKIQLNLPPGFMKLKYQEHAVKQAYKIIEMHGGVFISDVVGLGKTIIAAMLSKSLKGRKLFIVPPVIKQQWEEILKDFDLPRSDTVESSGKI